MTSGATEPPTDGAESDQLEEPEIPLWRRAAVATGLIIAAAVGLAGTVGLLGFAASRPAVLGVDDAADPVGWVQLLALPVAVLAILQLALLGQQRAWWAQLFVGACTLAFLVVSGCLVWLGLPSPGPEFGLGMRLPWALVACVLGVVATAVYALAAGLRRRAVGGSGRALTTTVTAVVVLVFGAVSVTGVLAANSWTGAQNTDVALAKGSLTGQRPSALDGRKRWQSATTDEMAATRGGVVVHAGPGLYAVDPTTGEQRWHYFSWGTSFEGTPVVSADGRYVAVTADVASGLERLMGEGSSDSEVYVFDAVRGRLLDHFDAHGDLPRYVDDDVVIVAAPPWAESAHGVTAYRHDGGTAWEMARGKGCSLGAAVGLGDSVLVGRNCAGNRVTVSVRDATSGREAWGWKHEGYISPNGVVVPRSGPGKGTVVVDLSGDYDGQRRRDAHFVAAFDIETGKLRWSRADVRLGTIDDPGESPYSYLALYAQGTLVLTGAWEYEDDPTLEMVGLDPANGDQRWHRHVALGSGVYQKELLPEAGYPGLGKVVGVAVGRVVVAAQDFEGTNEVIIHTVDVRMGQQASPTSVPRGREGLEHLEGLYVVGDTVAVSVTPEGQSDHYLVGLG